MATTPLQAGAQARIFVMSPTAAGTQTAVVTTEADTILISLFAGSVSGTLDVNVYNVVGPAQTGGAVRRALAFSFPQLTATTADLLLRRGAVTTEQVEIEVVYSGPCEFEIWARAIYAGSTDTKILGAASLRVSQVTVTTTPVILIPASLNDRSGIVIKNWSTTTDLFVGESAAKATSAVGYPLAARDGLAIDLAAGQAIWGVAGSGTVDVRLGESGG